MTARFFLSLSIAMLLIVALPRVAFANCTSPAAPETQTFYDFTNHLLKYCDGTNWINLSGGTQWSNGAGSAIYYNDGNVGIGTAAPATTALLDVSSTTKGFLPPRMTTVQRDAVASPATGLMIFNTTNGGLEYYTGTAWAALGFGVPTGTIAAFAATSCPTGWTEYAAARGRFLRGIDNGAGNDPDGTRTPGNTQADELKAHIHLGNNLAGKGGYRTTAYTPGTDPNIGGANNQPGDAGSTGSTGGAETRPKNIAVLFCQYSGSGGGGGSGGITALTGDVTASGSGSVAASIADDIVNFGEMADAMTLDASTDISATGSNALSITNSGTGASLRVNDEASDTTPFVIDAGGNVGIGTASPTRLLDIYDATSALVTIRTASYTTNLWQHPNGNFYIYNTSSGTYLSPNSTSWTSNSDIRLKKNIQTLSVLDRLDRYRAVSFDWRFTDKHDIGVIAQEIYKIFPELVNKGSDDPDGKIENVGDANAWGVKYDKLGALALQAVKELKADNDNLRAANDNQDAQIRELREEIKDLKTAIH